MWTPPVKQNEKTTSNPHHRNPSSSHPRLPDCLPPSTGCPSGPITARCYAICPHPKTQLLFAFLETRGVHLRDGRKAIYPGTVVYRVRCPIEAKDQAEPLDERVGERERRVWWQRLPAGLFRHLARPDSKGTAAHRMVLLPHQKCSTLELGWDPRQHRRSCTLPLRDPHSTMR